MSSCFGMSAGANPHGPQVVHGNATFQGLNTGNLQITNSPGTIINWQGFSIGAGQVTNFIQQSASSAVLNRVGAGPMSQIDGLLSSNGRVFLINPAGIVVGATGVIDSAGFVGSTLNMLDADFLASRLKFSGDASAGGITNHGTIRTSFGGSVVLIAPHITNAKDPNIPNAPEALIQTPGGELILAAGQKVTIGTLDANGVQFEVQAPTDSVVNLGRLIAQGGAVGLFAGTLRHSGDIRADALVRDEAGRVVLKAQGETTLAGGSTISATGRRGGDITVLGDQIAVSGGAVIDASGQSAGGRIRIGGDYQGANAALTNAATTRVDAGALLHADATRQGDGGRIIVWSDRATTFLGNLSAHGGPQGGNGGFAEVSGHETLNFAGGANLGAERGALGTLLLDPLDLYVRDGGGQFGNILGSGSLPANAVTVAPSTLAAINGNVSLYASRYMLIDGVINLTTAGQSLTAEVGTYTPGVIPGTPLNQLDIARNITTTGGAVSLTAPFIQALNTSTITTGGGAVTLNSTADTRNIQGFLLGIDAGTGLITATGRAGVQLGALTGSVFVANVPGSISTGAITITNPLALTGTSVSTGLITSNGANVAINSTSSSIGLSGVTAGAGNVTLTGATSVSGGTIDTTGNVSLTATEGTVSARVNNAASLTASSRTTSTFQSASVNIGSDTALNATSLDATATGCTAFSCTGAFVTVNAVGNINVGTVAAAAPVSSSNSKSASVSLSSTTGSIFATSAASQVRGTDVTLSTAQGSGGGIGSADVALNAAVERSFTFRPNGDFRVVLNGTGPNALSLQPGVAATGQTYAGTLTRSGGGINFAATANDTTVTVSDLTVTGFDQSVFNSSPSITLRVPNGALVATNISVPQGDTFVPVPPATTPATQPLPVSISASGDLTVNTYTRQSTAASLPKSTSFFSTNGSVTLGTINASRDSVSVSGSGDVTISSLTAAGTVSASSSFGNLAVGQIDTTGGSGSVSLSAQGKVAALNDTVALEVLSGGTLNVSGRTIGEATFTNPLDVAATRVSMTSANAGGQIGFAGRPVVANTSELTLNAASAFAGGGATFNVSTGATALKNLTVVANPSAVGSGGVAQVRTEAGQPNDRTYSFVSDGTHFSFGTGAVPATQFANGTLGFTSTSGNIALADSNVGPTGSLAVTALNGSITGSAVLDGMSLALAAGTGSSGTAVTLSTGNIGSSNTSSISLTSGGGFGSSIGSIQTGTINSASSGTIGLTSVGGNIDVGATGTANIGSSGARAGAITMSANNGSGGVTGRIRVGDIFGSSAALTSLENNVTAGNIDTTGDVTILSHRVVNTGTLDVGSVSITNEFFINNFPQITVGTIGATRAPSTVLLLGQVPATSGTAVSVLGPVTGAAGSTITIAAARNGAVALGGPVNAGAGSTININHAGDNTFQFTTLNAGAGGTVNITSRTGIEQTVDTAGSGITAGNVMLRADNGAMFNSADPGSRLDLNTVSALQVRSTGSVALDAHGSTLRSLDVTKNRTVALAPFELANLGSGQVVTMSSAPSDMTFVATSPTAPLDVTLTNAAGGIALGAGMVTSGGNVTLNAQAAIDASPGILTGGATGGGAVALSTTSGNLTAGTIDTTPTGTGTGGAISLTTHGTPGNIVLTGDLRTGPGGGAIALTAAASGDITRTGSASIVSGQPVTVIAARGSIGTAAAPLLITSPNVTLSARDPNTEAGRGFAFAALDGTTQLGLIADNGFNVTSTAGFTTLSLNTKGGGSGTPGAGTLNLAAPGQLYAFDRPTLDAFGAPITNTFQVITAAGATPPTEATFNTLSGDLLVTGGASLTSPTLNLGTLGGTGDVILQGTAASPLALSNPTQNFSAPRDLLITGRVTLTGTDQTIFPHRHLTVQARDGSVSLSGGTQNISTTTGTMRFLGGAGADETVTVSASTSQRIFTPENQGGDAIFRGGAGDRSNVTLVYTGPNVANALQNEEQRIEVHGNVIVEGGAGANSDALITTATADQLIRAGNRFEPSNTAIGNISVLGGSGAGADGRITNTGPGYQQVGESRQFCGISCFDFQYQSRNLTVMGGAGAGSLAEITATGAQQIYSRGGTTTVMGGAGAGSNAKIESTSTIEQRIGQPNYLPGEAGNSMGALLVSGGTGVGSTGSVTTPSGQRVTTSGMFTVTGNATNSSAVVSGATQEIRTGGVTVTGGTGDNAPGLLQSAGTQVLRALSFLNSILVGGGAGAGSTARITSADTQSLSFTALTVRGGTATGATARVDTPAAQTLNGGSVTVTAQGTTTAPVANAGALIEGQSQSIVGSSIALNGGVGVAGATSDAIIRNLTGAHVVRGSSVALTGGVRDSTTAIINAGTDFQNVFGSGGVTLASGTSAEASAPVMIQNTPATLQTVCTVSGSSCTTTSFVGGPIRLTNSGAGMVAITSAGNQIFKSQTVDVTTAAGSAGTSTLNAAGTQWIHTANSSTSVPSMRVAALGTGKASVESGSTQLLEIDYPDVMAPGSTRTGDLIIGDAAAGGTSLVQAVDQAVFARSLTVQSGSGAGSNSKLGASATQSVSTVIGGITVTSGTGTGATATIDPTVQSIVSNGPVNMTGNGGPVSMISSGPQTLIVTNGPLNLNFPTGTAPVSIVTTGPGSQQVVLASGGVNIGPFASIGAGPEAASAAPATVGAAQIQRSQDELDSTLTRASSETDETTEGRKAQAGVCR